MLVRFSHSISSWFSGSWVVFFFFFFFFFVFFFPFNDYFGVWNCGYRNPLRLDWIEMDGSKENHLGLLMPSSDLQGWKEKSSLYWYSSFFFTSYSLIRLQIIPFIYLLKNKNHSFNYSGGSRMEGIKLMKEMTAQNNIRRALSSINQNIMEATRNQKPCVINRGDLSM